MGISADGNKEILDYRLFPSESSEYYREMLRDIHARGVEEVLLFISDGLKELRNVFLEEYPKAQQLNRFVAKYTKKYPKAVKVIKDNPSLFTFYDYPEEIQRSIYTSNPIESFNKKLKRNIRKKEQFPNEDSLDRFTCVIASDYNKQFQSRQMKRFKKCTFELQQPFEKWY